MENFEAQLRGFGIRTMRQVDQVRRASALELFRLVIFATPVDTGRLRGNWQTTINSPATGDRNMDDPTGGMSYWQAMGHAFWESDDRAWSLMVEYEFDQRVRNDRGAYIGHRTGVAMRAPKVGGSTWRPAVRWEHAFQDDSGKVIPGISGTVAPSLSMSIGVPVVYGAPGTFYRDALIVESGEAAEDREPGAIPIDNVVSVLVAVSLSFSF